MHGTNGRTDLRTLFICGVILTAGCAAIAPVSQPQHSLVQAAVGAKAALPGPAVIAVNQAEGTLEYWPMQKGGSRHPVALSSLTHLFRVTGMVANGNVLALANDSPAEVLEYDTSTGAVSTLPDPNGSPLDIAIGKDGSLYVVNFTQAEGNVTMYPGGSSNPIELTCPFLDKGGKIAVDNEGDIFVTAFTTFNTEGVVEIPSGADGPDPRRCMLLNQLMPAEGYIQGLLVDPKTDDLVVMDDPGGCAGGDSGRLMIYRKPYKAQTAVVRVVGQNCAFGIRLSADSSTIFVLDADVSDSNPFVLARSFPGGGRLGTYSDGQSESITTIPNTLPN
jgi:hypothetical protein